MGPHESQTRESLLGRLAQAGEPDQAAWKEFVQHYGPKVQQWCQRWGLQVADADDVTQMVLLKLSVRMKDFTYNPERSFRAWLKTVAYHTWLDFVESQKRSSTGQGGNAALQHLESAAAREDLARRLEERFDQELLDRAMATVQQQVAPHNWQAFRLTALERVTPEEAARQLGIKVARVYAARSQIVQQLRQECRRLEERLGLG
jgi:RNA polymerase sigma-70 factor (ECF subfamily)